MAYDIIYIRELIVHADECDRLITTVTRERDWYFKLIAQQSQIIGRVDYDRELREAERDIIRSFCREYKNIHPCNTPLTPVIVQKFLPIPASENGHG